MIPKLPVIAAMVFMCSYAVAGTTAIGTASARGDMRVDGYSVNGNATLFDGTVVETGQATAALRLGGGVEIKLGIGSRSTLHRDRIVLEQGASEFAPSSPFSVEAKGLRVTPSEPNSRAVVSMTGLNTVDVAALAGGFQVTNGRGLVLAHLTSGRAMSFAMQAETSGTIKVEGQLYKEGGHYYILESLSNTRYLLNGKGFFWSEGKEVIITGTVDQRATPTGGAKAVVNVVSMTQEHVSGEGIANGPSWVIVGSIAAAGAIIGWAIEDVSSGPTPASQ